MRTLEERVLLNGQAYFWSSAPVSQLWTNPKNWDPKGVPGEGDIASISTSTTVIAPLGATTTVANLELFKGTLEIAAGATIKATQLYHQNPGATLTGSGTLEIADTRGDKATRQNPSIIAGTMTGGGKTILETGWLNIQGDLTLDHRRFNISFMPGANGAQHPTVQWVSGDITLQRGAKIDVEGEGTFACGSAGFAKSGTVPLVMFDGGGANQLITEAGAFFESNYEGSTNIHVMVASRGWLKLLAGTLSIDRLTIQRGNVVGMAGLVINRLFVWQGGTFGNTAIPLDQQPHLPLGGAVTAGPFCLSLLSGHPELFGGWRLFNQGHMFLSGGANFKMTRGALFVNDDAGAFYIDGGSDINGDEDSEVINRGYFQESGAAICTVASPFRSFGPHAVVKQTNQTTLHFKAAVIVAFSLVSQDPDTIVTDYPLDLAGATLEGAGTNTVAGDLINEGNVEPGGALTPGGLIITRNGSDAYPTGNYVQTTGWLGVDIEGAIPIRQYDQINVDGIAQLGGTLNINTLDGFWPTAGQSFVIMTFASSTGGFSQINWPQGPPGDSTLFTIQYNPTNITLVAVDKPPPDPAVVTSVSPNDGPTGGGTTVTIGGSNFTGAMLVTFGGVEASSFTVNSDASITAVAPPHTAGTVDVQVYVPGGPSQPALGDQYTYIGGSGPSLSGVSPNSGSVLGNNAVTIGGTGFTGASAVTFGGVPALSFSVNSDSSITAVAPPHSAGIVDIAVTTPDGTSGPSANDQYTYQAVIAPTLSGLAPLSGSAAGGTWVNLTGSNFSAADGVFFGDQPATQFIIDSPTLIAALVPPGVAGTVDVTVTSDDTASAVSAVDRFTYTGTAGPVVSSVSPASCPAAGGTVVSVSGSGFTGASTVLFGTVPASSFAVLSDGLLSVLVPAGTVGTVDIRVLTSSGVSPVGSADQFAYLSGAAPAVSGLSISAGGSGGGQVLTISGTGFTGASNVLFGSLPAAYFTILSDTMLIAVAPPQVAGTQDVRVTTPSGTSATGSGDLFSYTAAPAPAVGGLATSTGLSLGGTAVVITGSGFTGASAVSFGSVAAEAFAVNSDTSITAISPAGVAGVVDVTVTTPSGTSAAGSADQFTYTAAAVPAISGISQTSASSAGGTVLFLTGSGFTGASSVNFGATPVLDFTVNSDNLITVDTPPAAVGTFDITVTGPSGRSAAVSSDRFTVTLAATPAVGAVSAASGSTGGGSWVTITGSAFTGTFSVQFGQVAASAFYVNSDTSIAALVPPQAAGTVDVSVMSWSGTSAVNVADQFTYISAGAPSVSALATTGGTTAGGTYVTLTGSGFTGASAVLFGGVPAAGFVVNSDNSISAYAPPQAAGTVDITVTTPSGTSATSSADRFAYSNAPAPSVAAITPATGTTPGGTAIIIVGSGFTGATGVKFGSVPASSFTVNSDSSITAISPPEAAGTVHVTVTTYSGTSSTTSADQFTYTNVSQPAPSVAAVSPNTGYTAGGETVTITGQYFSGATNVTFGGVAASFTINSDTSITAISPPNTSGQVTVQVTTSNGHSNISTGPFIVGVAFTYITTQVPQITSLSPNTGTTAGGNTVIIRGANFTNVKAVMFGGVAATGYTVNSAAQITATAPAQAAGAVGVTVRTSSGTSAAATYTYTTAPLPTVASLSGNSGPTGGGTSVTITGTNFTGATGVSFGGVPASSFSVVSATSITATAPADYAGTIDVTITT